MSQNTIKNFSLLAQPPVSTSETALDCYYQKLILRIANEVVKRFCNKTTRQLAIKGKLFAGCFA